MFEKIKGLFEIFSQIELRKIIGYINIPEKALSRTRSICEGTFIENKHRPLRLGYVLAEKSNEIISFNVGCGSVSMLSIIVNSNFAYSIIKVYLCSPNGNVRSLK